MKKMVMVIVPRDEASRVLEALVSAGYTATFSESRGGALRQAQQTLFIAVDQADLEKVLATIRDSCRTRIEVEPAEARDLYSLGPVPVIAELGGAVVFIWDLDRIETY
jgi:uncharacterized protein YaaQ